MQNECEKLVIAKKDLIFFFHDEEKNCPKTDL